MKPLSFLLTAFAATAAPVSAQLVLLEVSDPDIRVGEVFSVEVVVLKDVVAPDAELLSFAFDVFNSASVAYLGTLVAPPFSDDSGAIPYDVGGSVFPGLMEPVFTIATMSFRALSEDSGTVSIFGPVDPFGGLKYTTFDPFGTAAPFLDEDFPIEAGVRFPIGPGEPVIPEPSVVGLLGFGLVAGLLMVRRRR